MTPTRNEIYAKALELFMEEMYTSGMKDVPTPEENELKEGSYWERARRELMISPEKKAFEDELGVLEQSAGQLEEVAVEADTLKKLLDAYRDIQASEEKLRDLKRKRKQESEVAKERVGELEEQLEKTREEAKKKPALKIRILQNFREGIQYFKKGDVMETHNTHNIEWALNKIEQGLAERVGVEVPVKVVPEVPREVKPEVRAPADLVRYLTDVFVATLSRNNVPIRPEYRARLRLELPAILTLREAAEQEKTTEMFAMSIVNEYKSKVELARRERERPPPTVKGGWLLPNGRFIPVGREGEEVERIPEIAPKLAPPAASLWRWLFDTFQIGAVDEGFKSLDDVKKAFYALPKEEQESLIAQYRTYLPAFKYPDLETFLKVKYDLTLDEFAQLDNERKKVMWNEYWAES